MALEPHCQPDLPAPQLTAALRYVCETVPQRHELLIREDKPSSTSRNPEVCETLNHRCRIVVVEQYPLLAEPFPDRPRVIGVGQKVRVDLTGEPQFDSQPTRSGGEQHGYRAAHAVLRTGTVHQPIT